MYDENPVTEEAKKVTIKKYDPRTINIEYIAQFVHKNDLDSITDDAGHRVTSFDKYKFVAPSDRHYLYIAFWPSEEVAGIAAVTGFMLAKNRNDVAENIFVVVHPSARRIGIATVLDDYRKTVWKEIGVKKAIVKVKKDNKASIKRLENGGWRRVEEGRDIFYYELGLDEKSGKWG